MFIILSPDKVSVHIFQISWDALDLKSFAYCQIVYQTAYINFCLKMFIIAISLDILVL